MDECKIKTLLYQEGYRNNPELIANDILTFCRQFQRFNVFATEIVHPPAFSQKDRLICVHGLLPITSTDGSLRTIPISVYLCKGYPITTPICYIGLLGPRRDYTVQESPLVDTYGRIRNIGYLDPEVWQAYYNLSRLMQELTENLSPYCYLYDSSNQAPLAFNNINSHQPPHSMPYNNNQPQPGFHRSVSTTIGNPYHSVPHKKSHSVGDAASAYRPPGQVPLQGVPGYGQSVPYSNSADLSPEAFAASQHFSPPLFQQPSSFQQPLSSFYMPPTPIPQQNFQHKQTPPVPTHREDHKQIIAQGICDEADEEDDIDQSTETMSKSVAKHFEKLSVDLSMKIDKLEDSNAEMKKELSSKKTARDSLGEKVKTLEDGVTQMEKELDTAKKEGTELKEKIRKMEEDSARMQEELVTEKQASADLQATIIPDLLQRIQLLENSLQSLEWAWVISRDEIQILHGKQLGAGGWGTVNEAIYRGRRVAAKCMHAVIQSPHNMQKFEKEMRLSAFCRHRNLVEFIGAVMEQPAIILIEMMDKSLQQALFDKDITPANSRSVYMDVARGLNYLHNLRPYPVIHRDISSPNVLLKIANPDQGPQGGWIAKVSDFGSAQFAHLAQTPGPGCILYSAPEVRSDEPAQQTVKIDVYSYGVLLVEILTMETPNDSLRRFLQKLETQKPQFLDLVNRCTKRSPEDRPLMNAVIAELQEIND